MVKFEMCRAAMFDGISCRRVIEVNDRLIKNRTLRLYTKTVHVA